MRILGIDASLSSTGYCVIEYWENKEVKVIATGVIQTKKDKFDNEDWRIYHICNELSNLIKEHEVNKVAIEEQFMARNSKTVLALRKMLGAIMYMVCSMDLNIDYIYPTTVRKLLLNNGKAKKDEVAAYIQANIIDVGEYSDKPGKKKTSDIYDAIAVAVADTRK